MVARRESREVMRWGEWWHHLWLVNRRAPEWAAPERRPQCSVQEGGQTDFMHSLYLWLLFISLTAMDLWTRINYRFNLECSMFINAVPDSFLTFDTKIETYPPCYNARKPTVAVKSLRFLSRTWCIQNIVFLFKYCITSFKGLKVVKIFQLSSSIHWWDETRTLQMTTKHPLQLLRH